MNKQRLLKLAEYLETVPEKNFDMLDWSCGTTACAIGHACNIPEFSNLGLRLELEKVGEKRLIPIFQDTKGWIAVELFFELDFEESGRLFCRCEYAEPTAKNVVKRIKELCK